MALKQEVLSKMLDLTTMLKRRNVIQPNGYQFGVLWTSGLIRYFERETAARSVTYPALLWLDHNWRDGEIEVTREGDLMVRLKHEAGGS